MHLHSLRMTAFGPFGAEVEVDFDQLSGAGLFLLTGPTGAGKSSVLDAVCFGLYGVVPGARQSARQLRSDHAAADTKPVVELEFSVGGRRFLIRRSPAWQRPKRRGTGVTTQHAAVTLEEHQHGSWQVLSTRLDETGDLISGLLGMQPSQFTQVAMLPQGEFQQFLGAKSDERQAILQRLFRTDRFEGVERWLRERRQTLRIQCAQHLDHVATVLSRIEEAADVGRPESFAGDDLSHALRSGAVSVWLNGLAERATLQSEAARDAVAADTTSADAARAAHRSAVALAGSQQRGRAAADVMATLAATAHSADLETELLEADALARPALALAREQQQAETRLAVARDQVNQTLTGLGLPAETSLETAREKLTTARRRLHAVEDFAPHQRTLEEVLARRTEVSEALDAIQLSVPTMQTDLSGLPLERESLQAVLDDAEDAATTVAGLRSELLDAEAGLAAAGELVELEARLSSQQIACTAAVQHHQDLREICQDLREARINAMAGELARQLTVGCSCPVCGSHAHPHPARVTEGVGAEAEDAARAEMDDAAIAAETLRDAVRTLEHRVSSLLDLTLGRDVAAWSEEVARRQSQLHHAEMRASRLPATRAELSVLTRRETELTAAIRTARAETTQLESQLAHLDDTAGALGRRLDEVLDGLAGPDLATAHDHLEQLVHGLEQLTAQLNEVHSCVTAEKHAARAVLEEAGRAGFADVRELQAAALGDAERQDMLVRRHERERAESAARATLAEPEVTSAMTSPTPDLVAMAALADQAETRRDAALTQLSRLSLRADRLSTLSTDLAGATARWLPVFEEWQVVTGLAELVEGKAADNEFRMRLSAYVLSERLGQVVDAANDRLIRMGGERFTLEQSDHGAARDRRGGLGLRVRDAWTSTQRETGTLSGGETFVVSLALALGLADTVTAESGGTQIDTLFVDEGFGSLDAESLEGVLDTLDSLREGGRAVGVVSHVAEMRERIPTQVQVSSSPQHGATLRVVLGH